MIMALCVTAENTDLLYIQAAANQSWGKGGDTLDYTGKTIRIEVYICKQLVN